MKPTVRQIVNAPDCHPVTETYYPECCTWEMAQIAEAFNICRINPPRGPGEQLASLTPTEQRLFALFCLEAGKGER